MPTLRLTANRGAIETMPAIAVPDGYVASAQNVVLDWDRLLLPRWGTDTFSLTSGPSVPISKLFTERLGGSEALWAFTNVLGAYRYSAGWSSVSLTDTPAGTSVQCCAYNGKVFIAYDSAVNRLHVYDAKSATMRRVGLGAVTAPTVANTGAGAYAATLRYYKVQFRIKDGSITLASSELSSATSFTPSGAGTAARVTKPTTVDSATHWVVYGSADGVTYYDLSGDVAVATTTYDDSTAPASYTGTVAPTAGLYVPPPSVKFITTDGERLIMAGAYETTAGSGETTPSAVRVWFTRPLGATDKGDDEAITQTVTDRYYLDIINEDGSSISGLAAALDGSIYVFTQTSMWRLVATGQSEAPFRPERVSATVGAYSQNSVALADTEQGGSAVYFVAADGPYRYSPQYGMQWIGEDWVTRGPQPGTLIGVDYSVACYCPQTRQLFIANTNQSPYTCRVFAPDFAASVDGVVRGGWTTDVYDLSTGTRNVLAMTVYAGKLLWGGSSGVLGAGAGLFTQARTALDGSTAIPATITTKTWLVGDGTRNATIEEPYLYGSLSGQTVAVSYVRNYGSDASDTVTDTTAFPTITGSYAMRKLEGLTTADAYALKVSLTVAAADRSKPLDRLDVPIIGRELA